jgi:hypothetical protein
MAPELLWVINPGAEIELAGKTPPSESPRFRAAMERLTERFAWLTAADRWVSAHNLGDEHRGMRALPWCPTPWLHKVAERSGVSMPEVPSLPVLRRVHHKSILIGTGLPGPPIREFASSRAELEAIAGQSPPGATLRLKQAYSYAGRGQRRMGPGSRDDPVFLRDAFRSGGLVVESELDVTAEYSIHGYIPRAEGSEIEVGSPCAMRVDEYGSVSAVSLLAAEHRQQAMLRTTGRAAGALLRSRGYFGPFGLDCLETSESLVASDLNPRFTLGWSVGMGAKRAHALADYAQVTPDSTSR